MKTIQRILTNICSVNLEKSKHFYTTLFDFDIAYDSDWFIQLVSKDKQLELGVMDRNHELVPNEFRATPNGFYLTLVVESADKIFEAAKSEGFEVIEEPTDTFYGQRRLLLKDPDGALIDVSSPIPNFQF